MSYRTSRRCTRGLRGRGTHRWLGGQERELRRRIGSIQSTKKITRAMELIAASRVVRAQGRAAEARPYAEQITGVILDLTRLGAEIDHPLLREEDGEGKTAFVVVTSDRGLAGAYNNNVLRTAERELQDRRADGRDYALVTIGNKAQRYFRFRGYRIDAAFSGMTDQPTYEDARQVAAAIREPFESGGLRHRRPRVHPVHLARHASRSSSGGSCPSKTEDSDEGDSELHAAFEFEPSPEGILDALLPRYVEARLFSALLDASASEHAARQRAMKAATDNAEDLITTLTPQHEPGPPGRHHHRDHGGRRRRRGPEGDTGESQPDESRASVA